MTGVYEEFEQQLADWQRRHAANPRKEMILLFLLALEREELTHTCLSAHICDHFRPSRREYPISRK